MPDKPHTPPLIIVPARMGSRRILDKNFRPFAYGESLTTRALSVAAALKLPATHVVLTTDYPYGKPINFTLHRRPDALCGPDVPMQAVIVDVLQAFPEGDPVVVLQPTQPFRVVGHVKDALRELAPTITSVVTVTTAADGWPAERDGTVYAFWRDTLELHGDIYGPRMQLIWIPSNQSFNINTPEDWARAEQEWLTKDTWMTPS